LTRSAKMVELDAVMGPAPSDISQQSFLTTPQVRSAGR